MVLHPATAYAQWSGSVAALSEYRYRGNALSEGKPSVQAGVAYDAGGWYAGGFAAGTRWYGRRGAQWLLYAGRAGRLANGMSWDAGISTVRTTNGAYGGYNEVYTGLWRGGAAGSMSARLSWSPRYAGGDARTLYAELDAGTAVSDRIDAFFHAGLLHALSGPRVPQRADVRVGLSARVGEFGVQVAYDRNNHRGGYAVSYPGYYGYTAPPSRDAVIVSVSRGF
ncbi:TorF family putative porin [Massilia sp. METH4]|uniref:TorF family putative porin n=1 Tax=Massilia sp. METH4 TaxID=3123041 RepID=UPI0030CF996F